MKKLLFTIIASGLVFCACKKDKKDNPNPNSVDTTTKVIPIPVVEIRNIKLYNQALDATAHPYWFRFYNITNRQYSNSVDSPIEIAFVHHQPTDNSSKYLLGCAASMYVSLAHGVPKTNKTYTEFYKIDNGTNTLVYDTISLSSSIEKIFATKATKSVILGESNAIQSFAWGWFDGSIFGFKLSNGKRGLILLTAIPTGSKDPKTGDITLGDIKFNIKMEK
ncbi:MAG: hypothetical protein NVV82_29125 [Sporocytophaga sp.]|nr:hypothetical protein [Sporocytophaga sp.]